MTRILIVDDHALVREGLRALLERHDDLEIVADCGDGQEAIRLATEKRPDVVLMDIGLPGGIGGFEATEAILAELPNAKVIVLTQYENPEYIKRAVRIGVHGYLLKSGMASQLHEAIVAVLRGQRYLHPQATGELVRMMTEGEPLTDSESGYDRLTPRERQVFTLLTEGKTSREIARYLGISVKTAMTHRAHVMEKLDLHSRTELIRYAVRHRIIQLGDD